MYLLAYYPKCIVPHRYTHCQLFGLPFGTLINNCAHLCSKSLLKKPQTLETAHFFDQNNFLPHLFRINAKRPEKIAIRFRWINF